MFPIFLAQSFVIILQINAKNTIPKRENRYQLCRWLEPMLVFQPLLSRCVWRPKKPAFLGREEQDVLVDAGEIKRLQTASLNIEGEVERSRNGPIDLQPLSKRKGLVRRDEGWLGWDAAKCFMRRESGHGDRLGGGTLGRDWLVNSLSYLRAVQSFFSRLERKKESWGTSISCTWCLNICLRRILHWPGSFLGSFSRKLTFDL